MTISRFRTALLAAAVATMALPTIAAAGCYTGFADLPRGLTAPGGAIRLIGLSVTMTGFGL
jgi:hypothetical protein